MATSAQICIKLKNGKLKGVRCNYDGYLKHTGKILLENYNTSTLITKLISLGDISVLEPKMNKPAGHTFSNPIPGHTIFYGRDRGEKNTSAKTYDTIKEIFDYENVDYVYVFDKEMNKWLFCKFKGPVEILENYVPTSKMAKGGYLEGREEYEGYQYQIWFNPNKRMYSVSDNIGIFKGDNEYFKNYDQAKEHAEMSIRGKLLENEEYGKSGSIEKYKVKVNQYIPYRSNKGVNYFYVVDENNNTINKNTGKVYRGKEMNNYKFSTKQEAERYAEMLNNKMIKGGEVEKRIANKIMNRYQDTNDKRKPGSQIIWVNDTGRNEIYSNSFYKYIKNNVGEVSFRFNGTLTRKDFCLEVFDKNTQKKYPENIIKKFTSNKKTKKDAVEDLKQQAENWLISKEMAKGGMLSVEEEKRFQELDEKINLHLEGKANVSSKEMVEHAKLKHKKLLATNDTYRKQINNFKYSKGGEIQSFIDDFILDDVDWDDISTKSDLMNNAKEIVVSNLSEYGITKFENLSKEQQMQVKTIVDDEWNAYKTNEKMSKGGGVDEKSIEELVEKKRRRWYSDAGGMSVMIDDMPEEDYDKVIDGFRKEAIEELSNKKMATGGGVGDKMTYDEMKAYEKSNHIHYNPMNSRWEVTKNGEHKEFWNQEEAEKFARFEFDYEKDSRYSRKKYEALFGYSDGGVIGNRFENNYKEKTEGEVWDKIWTLDQKYHFLDDHVNQIGFNEEFYHQRPKTTKRIQGSNGTEIGFRFNKIDEIVKMKKSELPRYVKFHLEHHIRDGQYADGGSIYATGGGVDEDISFEIGKGIADMFKKDWNISKDEYLGQIVKDLGLVKGEIQFFDTYFNIKGETKNGDKLFVEQNGEYTMYGGPYTPKMEYPTIELNDDDIYDEVNKEYIDYGYDSNGTAIDITRTDIWGSVVSKLSKKSSSKKEPVFVEGDKVRILQTNDHTGEKYDLGETFTINFIEDTGGDDLYYGENKEYLFHPSDLELVESGEIPGLSYEFDVEDVSFETEGDYGFEYSDFKKKLNVIRKYIDFDSVSGSSNSYETDLDFFKNDVSIANLKGQYDLDNQIYTSYLEIGEVDRKPIKINFHPFDSMGGLDIAKFEKEIKEAVEKNSTRLKSSTPSTIPGLSYENELNSDEVDDLYEIEPKLFDPYYPKELIRQVLDIAYYKVIIKDAEYLLAMDTQGNWDDKWYLVKKSKLNKLGNAMQQAFSATYAPKEPGAAGVRIELEEGNINVYHTDSNEILLSLKDVPQGTWKKLWNFLRNDLIKK